jgi:hypothetical protein
MDLPAQAARPADINFGPRLGVPVLEVHRQPVGLVGMTVELRRIDLIRQLPVVEAAERDRRVGRGIDDRERGLATNLVPPLAQVTGGTLN